MLHLGHAGWRVHASAYRPEADARARRQAVLVAWWATAVALSVAVALTAPHAAYEPALGNLLRLMAGIKFAMALGGILLVHWRFARPMPLLLAGGYGAAVALMAAAPELIWALVHLPAAAVLFHAGLLLLLALAYVDRDDTGGMLAGLVGRRTAPARTGR